MHVHWFAPTRPQCVAFQNVGGTWWGGELQHSLSIYRIVHFWQAHLVVITGQFLYFSVHIKLELRGLKGYSPSSPI